MTRTAFIGECMIEISASTAHDGDGAASVFGPAKLSYAGDTLNAAVYMARTTRPTTRTERLGTRLQTG